MRAWGDFALYSPVIPVDVSREGVYFRTVTEAKRACKNINRVGMDHFIRGFV